MTTAPLAHRAEEACLTGLAASRHVILDAAVPRISGGYTRRANSVNLLGPLRRNPWPLHEDLWFTQEVLRHHDRRRVD